MPVTLPDELRVSADDERAAAEERSVLRACACAAPGPDEPRVLAVRQLVTVTGVAPRARQAEARPHRPGAEHLLGAAIELEVVVGRALVGVPAQSSPRVCSLAGRRRVERAQLRGYLRDRLVAGL